MEIYQMFYDYMMFYHPNYFVIVFMHHPCIKNHVLRINKESDKIFVHEEENYIILDGLEGDTRIYCQRC